MVRKNTEKAPQQEADLIEKLVSVNRVCKVVKGGKNFSFSALMIVGDGKGRVGFGTGKAREVPEAVRKATQEAKNTMLRVPLRDARTFHHDVKGHHGAGRVQIRAAKPGTGIIAGGAARQVLEALGVHDVVAKSIGTSNPHNLVRATFNALKDMYSPRAVANRRGLRVADVVARRGDVKLEKEQADV